MLLDCHRSKDVPNLCVQESHTMAHAVTTKIKSGLYQMIQIAIEVKNLGEPGD